MSEPKQQNRYETVVEKEFKSTIPPHLLGKLSDSERYLVETMSKLESQFNWAVVVILQNNRHIRDADERISALEENAEIGEAATASSKEFKDKVDKLWDWKQSVSGKWGVLGAVGIVILSVVLKFLLDFVLKKP